MRPLSLGRGLERTIVAADGPVEIRRDASGVPHVRAPTTAGAVVGLGWCHGYDRQLQMVLGRVIGQGRAAAVLEASDELVALDTLFRRLDLRRGAAAEVARMAPRSRALLEAYCDGVNRAFRHRT